MDGLPFLPGNCFKDPTKTRHHLSHTLNYKNGFQVQQAYPTVGIGGEQIYPNQLTESELDELANFQPTLTYGQAKQAPPEDFVPAHVAFDKKVLRFYGYFKESVHESPQEFFRVRPITLYYYLEDDSIAIVEPPVENSGIPQGKLIKRQRLPKNDVGDCYSWKDINLSTNICVYGRVFRITDCDKYTREFLESEGIVVNEKDGVPADPYIRNRKEASQLPSQTTKDPFDKLKKFLEMDRKVLRFFAIWDDSGSMFGEKRPFIIHYYLVDDTMEIREVHRSNDGRDPFPLLVQRGKIPKKRQDVKSSFPTIVMETSAQEIKEFFTPKDFKIGVPLVMDNRKFIMYDCDNFTKAWYYQNFGVTDFPSINMDEKSQELAKMDVPPYNGYGSLEDSLQSCLTLAPQPPKKDIIKMLNNVNKQLRYEAKLDSIRPEDHGRRFIICYRLWDDMISVFEPPIRNTGIVGGRYLEASRVAKPGSTPEAPEYYGPNDFLLGAKVDIFGQRFVITNADKFVTSFMKENPEQFRPDVISSFTSHVSFSSA